MESLTKENFWNELQAKYPKGMKVFCDWIDEYKNRVQSTAFGKSFKQWLKEDLTSSLDRERKAKNITEMEFTSYSSIKTSYDSQFIFKNYLRILNSERGLEILIMPIPQ